MDNKIILSIVVIAVVVVGGVGAVFMLGGESPAGVTYHGNGHKTLTGEDSLTLNQDVAPRNLFDANGMEMYNWNSKQDGSGTTVNIGEKIPSGVKDLYAQWIGSISYTLSTVLQPQYEDIKISSSTVIQGTVVNKDMTGNYGHFYNGTDTKLIFKCESDCDVYVNAGYVVFSMTDGVCASYKYALEDVQVVSYQTSGKTAEVTLSENTSGQVVFKQDVLGCTVDFKNPENLQFHLEVFDEAYDKPVAADENPMYYPAFDRMEYEIHIVCNEPGANVFACQPVYEDKTFSYRVNGVNQPTIHYRVTSTNGGYVYTGSTVGDNLVGYANYFLVPVSLAIDGGTLEADTHFVIEISTTAFSS